MAVLPITNPTLINIAQRLNPNEDVDTIVEALREQNEVLEDMSWRHGNQTGGHITTVRTGLSEPTFRKFYGTVQPTKTTTAQITATCGMLEDYSEVDAAQVELETDPAAFRLSEDIGKLQGFGNKVSRYVFYGNEGTEPEAFTGFSTLFNAKAGQENGDNIILGDGAGADECTSIWLVVWGENAAGSGIVPKRGTAGWQMTDKGKQTKETSTGMYEVYRTHYRWDVGLCVRDWRYVVRIANIKVSALVKDAATGSDLPDLISQALELPPSLSAGRPAIYCNRKIKSFLRRQIKFGVKDSTLTMEQIAGKHVMAIDGVPVRRVDSILNTESVIA